MADKYLLASREMNLWHYDRLQSYFASRFNLVDCSHSSANMDKKSVSMGYFLFADIDKELEKVMSEHGMEVDIKNKKIKLK